jgi:hypothetical protein
MSRFSYGAEMCGLVTLAIALLFLAASLPGTPDRVMRTTAVPRVETTGSTADQAEDVTHARGGVRVILSSPFSGS